MKLAPFASVYRGLCLLGYLGALPLLFLLSFKSKYRLSLPARFFLVGNPKPKECDVWLHACSLGEVKSLQPLIDSLQGERLLLTVITATGFREAKRLYPHIQVAFLPFEILLYFWAPRCKSLVVTEAELWFSLFEVAKRQGAKTILINARISERSYPKYQRFEWFYRRLFALVDEVFAQRKEDQARLESLGAKCVSVAGNLKLLSTPTAQGTIPAPPLPLVVAASTHEGEEALILEAFAAIPSGRFLAIVPRHPERFEAVWEKVKSWGEAHQKSVARRSKQARWWEAEVTLIDSLGELVELYALAEVAILGGAFAPLGGHNPLEPAHFGCKILSGTHIFNQRALFDSVEGYALVEPSELARALGNLDALPPSRIKKSLNPARILQAILHYHKEKNPHAAD